MLKRLAVVFTVYERHPAKPPEPPKEDFIGEARIPLVKIHKKLANADPSATEGVGGNYPFKDSSKFTYDSRVGVVLVILLTSLC